MARRFSVRMTCGWTRSRVTLPMSGTPGVDQGNQPMKGVGLAWWGG
jgi:hypothetical protein